MWVVVTIEGEIMQDKRFTLLPGRPDWPIIVWMVIVHVLGLFSVFQFTNTGFALLLILHFVTCCLGITFGYHRLLSHRSFKARRWLERLSATFGVLALQGSPLEWVGHHRMHHAHVDTPKDPHNARRGFWYSHIGWLFRVVDEFDDPGKLRKYSRDIVADKYLLFVGRPIVMIGLQVLLGLALWSVFGFKAMLWGIFVRIIFGYHATWCVNSISHMWGYRNYRSDDLSVNNWWVAVVAWGEGWHNNHHMHESIAPAGHKWWEFDVTMWVIRICGKFGWVWGIRGLPADLGRFDLGRVLVQKDLGTDAGPQTFATST